MKNKAYVVDLMVKLEDKKMINVSEKFIHNVENEYLKYIKEYKTVEDEAKKYNDSIEYLFTPEKLSKRSPLTLINAPWGTGKTYFIENLMKLLIDKEVESKLFKRMVIIDAWKFSNSKDVPLEFAAELTKLLLKSSGKNLSTEKLEKVVANMLRKVAPASLSWQISAGLFSFGGTHEKSKSTDKDADSAWNSITQNNVPTIIFIDNIERLGSLSWDLLKAILKMQEFTNYLIVLTVNLNKLKNNQEMKNVEYPIEKYIDFNYFDFKQDYSNFFRKYYTSEEVLHNLNTIFNSDIDGEKLSIREVEQSFKTKELFTLSKPYDVLRETYSIWNPNGVYTKLIKGDVISYLEFENMKMAHLKIMVSKLNKQYGKSNIYVNVPSSIINKGSDDILCIENKTRYYFNFDTDYVKKFKVWEKRIQERISEVNVEISVNDSKISKLNAKTESFQNKISKLDLEKDELEKEVAIESAKKEDYNTKTHSILTTQITNNRNKRSELLNDLDQINSDINALNNENLFLNTMLQSVYSDINKDISVLEGIYKSCPLSIDKRDAISKALLAQIPDANKKIDDGELTILTDEQIVEIVKSILANNN